MNFFKFIVPHKIFHKIILCIAFLFVFFFTTMIISQILKAGILKEYNQVGHLFSIASENGQIFTSNLTLQMKLYQNSVMAGEISLVDEAAKKSEASLAALTQLETIKYNSSETNASIKEMIDAIRSFTEQANVVYTAYAKEDDSDPVIQQSIELAQRHRNMMNGSYQLLRFVSRDLNKSMKSMEISAKKQMKMELVTVMSVMVILIFITYIIISNTINRPMEKIIGIIKRTSTGDLSGKSNIQSNDEMGKVSEAIDHMIDNLRSRVNLAEAISKGDLTHQVKLSSEKDTLGIALQSMTESLRYIFSTLHTSTDQVANGAYQILQTSQTQAQGAAHQFTSLKAITQSMGQVEFQTNANAESAQEASKLALVASSSAKNGVKKMEEMAAAISEINESSTVISKVISTIDGIAFQTNLLSLNAAVEAARAGKHGKGFAVVAQEVRNLAIRSAKAAQETANLIALSVQKVNTGNEIAKKTMAALDEINEGIARVADFVEEIAVACNEQALGISSINRELLSVDEITAQHNDFAERASAAAEELSAQASQVRQLLSNFKIS